MAGPAFASTSNDTGGAGLTVVQTLLLYVVTPIAIFTVITLLVVGPSMARASNDDTAGGTGVREPVLGESPRPSATPDGQRRG